MSLEQRIYLSQCQCWTGFRHIVTKFKEKFPNTHGCAETYKKISENWITD
jgi:hypothetical protein